MGLSIEGTDKNKTNADISPQKIDIVSSISKIHIISGGSTHLFQN